jgi:hypothetical protein
VQDDCGLIVGVEEDKGQGDKGTRGQGVAGRLVIWPNPASEGLSVKVLGLSEGISYSMVIYDIFGQIALSPCLLVPRSTCPQGGGWSWMVDVSALPPGIYLAVVRDDKTVIGTGKFVVAR